MIGDKPAAEALLLAALKETENFARDDPRRATVLSKLGSAYLSQGRYTAAESSYRRAIRLWERRADGNEELVRSVGNLAVLYTETGQYAKADRLELPSLLARASEFSLDDADVAWLRATLGLLDYRRARYAEAERNQNAALAISELIAPRGPETMQILNNLGLVHLRTRRYAEALTFYLRALAISEARLDSSDSMKALLLANVGTTHLIASRPRDAELFYSRALRVAESRLGATHPLVGRVLSCYAVVLRQTKRNAMAKDVERRAREILHARGPDQFRHMLVDASDIVRRH